MVELQIACKFGTTPTSRLLLVKHWSSSLYTGFDDYLKSRRECQMALQITENWIRERVGLTHDVLGTLSFSTLLVIGF